VGHPNALEELAKSQVKSIITKLDGTRQWDKLCSSRVAAASESPAPQYRESESGTNPVRFNERHEFRNFPTPELRRRSLIVIPRKRTCDAIIARLARFLIALSHHPFPIDRTLQTR